VEIHAHTNDDLESIAFKIRDRISEQPGEVILVQCRDEHQADLVSGLLSPEVLLYVQYSWPAKKPPVSSRTSKTSRRTRRPNERPL